MNQGIAISKFQRNSTRKLRLIADAFRGMDAELAISKLRFVRSTSNEPLSKAIRQAVANAKQLGLSAPFMITQLCIDKGPTYKRWQPVSRGQPHSIHKPTSHIRVAVSSTQAADPKKASQPSVLKRMAQTVTGKSATNDPQSKATAVRPDQKALKPTSNRSKPDIQRKSLPK